MTGPEFYPPCPVNMYFFICPELRQPEKSRMRHAASGI